jgi:hypothetical protein
VQRLKTATKSRPATGRSTKRLSFSYFNLNFYLRILFSQCVGIINNKNHSFFRFLIHLPNLRLRSGSDFVVFLFTSTFTGRLRRGNRRRLSEMRTKTTLRVWHRIIIIRIKLRSPLLPARWTKSVT